MCRRAIHNRVQSLFAFAAIFLLLLAGWIGTGVAMPAQLAGVLTGPLHEVAICAEGHARTIWLDAEGNEHSAPQECRDCPLCHMPELAANPELRLPAGSDQWWRHNGQLLAAQVPIVGCAISVWARGPPFSFSAWTVAVPSPSGDCLGLGAANPRQPMHGVWATARDTRA